MGRASRLKKVESTKLTKPVAIERVSPDLYFKRGKSTPAFVSEFWIWMAMRCSELAWRWPNLKAERAQEGETAGEWIIKGNPQGAQAFRDLAILAAHKIGYHGGPHGAVQRFLSHMFGDDIEMLKDPIRDPKTIDFLTQHSTGEREFHMGRQRHAGGENFTDAFERPKALPVEIPRPIVPLVNANGPKGVQ